MSLPFTAARPVEFPGPPPAKAEVAVIGGGIVGIASALFLARKGLRVVVLEKGRIAAEQSSRNWGWIRVQGRDPAEIPLMIEAQELWRGFAGAIGEGLGYRQAGVLYLARSERRMAQFEAWLGLAREHGLSSRMLTRAEIGERLPGHGAGWLGGIWTETDARAEPWAAVPLLARLAAGEGVSIVERCAVRALDLRAGRVAGVITEAGWIACAEVVLAGGAWSSLFLRNHGLSLPQLSVRATVAATAPLPEVFAGCASDGRLAFRRRADGGYTLAPSSFHEFFLGPDAFRHLPKYLPQLRADPFGSRYLPAAPPGYPDAWTTPWRWGEGPSPFERLRVLDPSPNSGRVERVRAAFGAAFPGLPQVRIAAAWAGMIDTLPDVVPVIGRAPVPGLTVATGMSGHGFGIGPGVGRVVADLVTGGTVGHDLARFRFGRFSGGTPIGLGPAL